MDMKDCIYIFNKHTWIYNKYCCVTDHVIIDLYFTKDSPFSRDIL